MSNFLMTFMDFILSTFAFNESLSASSTLQGEHTIGMAPGFMSKWTKAFLIVLTLPNKSGYSCITRAFGLVSSIFVLRGTGGNIEFLSSDPCIFPTGVNELVSATCTFLHLHLSSHCMAIRPKSIQRCNPRIILISGTSVT